MSNRTMMKTLVCAAVATALSAPLAVTAQTMNTPAASALVKADQQIVIGMAQANIAEIEAGKLALANSQNTEVKAYAQKMVDDHTKALADVTTLAQNKGVTLPTTPDAKHKAMAAKLSRLTGDTFDKMYMQQAGVQDHKQVHAMLKKNQARAKDADVKALAAKMMPTVEAHLTTATTSKPATR